MIIWITCEHEGNIKIGLQSILEILVIMTKVHSLNIHYALKNG